MHDLAKFSFGFLRIIIFFYSLFFASLANQYPPAFLRKDVPVQSLDFDLLCIFGVDDTIAALKELDVADSGIAILVLPEFFVKRGRSNKLIKLYKYFVFL